ncbi:hypothetical protein [Streptomyces gilvus]|uniref:hypothetical protein n=1 Tax=Streptomyces gilvus TaxID=2920937 RepID=UPI001F0E91EB|nr:hypothetical protein [Streptomyces sp. CME 23]MCH5677861.1 hypothetical protein [Streptomyces sp. CME 23]
MPTRAQRPRLPETSEAQLKARHVFNGGMNHKPRTTPELAVVEACTVEACGTPAVHSGWPPAEGMVRVKGSADGAAAHWYCPGRCEAIARARAELRAVPTGGEER